METMESLKERTRLFAQLGYPPKDVMAVLVVEGDRVKDEVIFSEDEDDFSPGLQPGDWSEAMRLSKERFRR